MIEHTPDERSRHRQFEDQFLQQLRARATRLAGSRLPIDRIIVEPTREGVDAVRSELGRLQVYDRDVLEKLAGARSVEVTFLKRRLGGLYFKALRRLRVRTLAPVTALLSNRKRGPVSREDVLDALARYELMRHRERPDLVVFASLTGFTPEAEALAETAGNRLVLMGARDDGGWDVAMSAALRKSPWAALFDFEGAPERLKRLLYHLEQNAAVLDTRGLALPELADKLGLSLPETELLVRQACRTQTRLMTVSQDGVTHLCRTPLAEEADSMNLWTRIRRMLRLKPTVAERVKDMTAQRVRIEQQRHEVDQKIDTLEATEREALAAGAAAGVDAERKQYAHKLVRVRTELKRLRTQAQNLTNALDVIGTHIHHLTLAEQNRRLELPRAEELTREAAQAEQMTAELAASADLARGIEVGATTPMMQEEEAAIFEEFKAAAASRSGASQAAPTQAAPNRAAAGERPASAAPREPPRVPTPPLPTPRESARPELS